MKNARPTKPPAGKCPNDADGNRESCPLTCKYNFFESDELTIHTYELKCLDCGWRDTIGYRSDEDNDTDNPAECPYCKNCDLTAGKNPCESK